MTTKNTRYLKNHKGLALAVGNLKIGDDTVILNMGPALCCPSDRLNKCACSDVCYAKKAEVQYPDVGLYRKGQQMYWLKNSAKQIADDIIDILHVAKYRTSVKGERQKLAPLVNKIKYLRLNESGDFWSQKCVNKLDHIARELKAHDIITYTYTARDDLEFQHTNFLVKGSDHTRGNNGACIARDGAVIDGATGDDGKFYESDFVNKNTRVYTICPGDCSACDICKTATGENIVFAIH